MFRPTNGLCTQLWAPLVKVSGRRHIAQRSVTLSTQPQTDSGWLSMTSNRQLRKWLVLHQMRFLLSAAGIDAPASRLFTLHRFLCTSDMHWLAIEVARSKSFHAQWVVSLTGERSIGHILRENAQAKCYLKCIVTSRKRPCGNGIG